MIGAGFSKFAAKAHADAGEPPLWRDLGMELSNRLSPHGSNEESPKPVKAKEFMRLAQEFKDTFGDSELYQLLEDLIRDGDHQPGNMHLRLLQLPWRDVFTTNWDTLLERASERVTEHKYSVLRSKLEIPLRENPRIIKLHGSLPSHFPLICTTKDYETYPSLYAPFVNTVQQSMMETVFCLIGFSGDDPNFHKWSQWVRKHLASSTLKIFLAGWLKLNASERSKLQSRGIILIDLAGHPNAQNWPDNLRHTYATDWILHTLERGRPYDVTDWPATRTWEHKAIPNELEPVVKLEPKEPRKEWLQESIASSKNPAKKAKRILENWAHNHRLYPGWLAVPTSGRSELSTNTNEYEDHIISAIPELSPVEALWAIRELVWRREVLLDPISSDLESVAETVLKRINCQTRKISGTHNPNVSWQDVRRDWAAVALALVTAARHSIDQTAFDNRIEALTPFLNDDVDTTQRVCHERLPTFLICNGFLPVGTVAGWMAD